MPGGRVGSGPNRTLTDPQPCCGAALRRRHSLHLLNQVMVELTQRGLSCQPRHLIQGRLSGGNRLLITT